jgi:hypothetical protein
MFTGKICDQAASVPAETLYAVLLPRQTGAAVPELRET